METLIHHLKIMTFQIASRLLGKILIDLRNTREEALSVADLKSCEDHHSAVNKTGSDPKLNAKSEDLRKSSFTSVKSTDQDDDEDKETKYRLDPKYVVFTLVNENFC